VSRSSWLPWTLCGLASAAAFWLVVETRRLAAAAGVSELVALQQQQSLAAARSALQASQRQLDDAHTVTAVLAPQVERLEGELHAALDRQQDFATLIEQRADQAEAERTARAAAAQALQAPMPEGVRQCLLALRDCLRADGFVGFRFLTASALVDQQLRDVELLDVDGGQLLTTLYVARRMTVRLDRERGELTLRFFDGHRRTGEHHQDCPVDGLPLLLRPVDGRLWEQRLPYLVQAEGIYPLPATSAPPAGTGLDVTTRDQWLERLNGLLGTAGTTERLHVSTFRGLRDGAFLQVALQGYDRKNLLRSMASCSSLSVEVDERAGVVQLLLRGGTMRSEGGEASISDDGYRMLLQAVTPKQAKDALLGMVVQK